MPDGWLLHYTRMVQALRLDNLSRVSLAGKRPANVTKLTVPVSRRGGREAARTSTDRHNFVGL
jgi:hypothetical protein